jgi:hypothetical protein
LNPILFSKLQLVNSCLGPSSPLACTVCCAVRPHAVRCPACSFLLCPCCASAGHNVSECAALARLSAANCRPSEELYNVVLPVRFALLKQRDREMYEWLGQYMDHNDLRHARNPALGRSTERMAVLVAACVPAVTAAEAVRLIGILFTNCFELNLGQMRARALYPLVSLVNHSCLPNLLHTNLIQGCCYMAYSSLYPNAIFFQPSIFHWSIFQRSIFQWVLYRYFNGR